MGTGCCSKKYDGIVQLESKEMLCRKREIQSKIKPLQLYSPTIKKNYLNLPNKFNKGKKTSLKIGLAGIQNMGNTCYINAAIQCISNIQPLTEYFLSGIHELELNERFNGEITIAYGNLIKAQWWNEYEDIQPFGLCNLI